MPYVPAPVIEKLCALKEFYTSYEMDFIGNVNSVSYLMFNAQYKCSGAMESNANLPSDPCVGYRLFLHFRSAYNLHYLDVSGFQS